MARVEAALFSLAPALVSLLLVPVWLWLGGFLRREEARSAKASPGPVEVVEFDIVAVGDEKAGNRMWKFGVLAFIVGYG